MVAEGTLAAIDSFLGNSERKEVANSSMEVEDSREGSSGGRKQKRTSEGEENEAVAKVRNTVDSEDKRTVVDMDKVYQGTVIACLSRLVDATERHTRTLEGIESLLVDNTVVMSKNADTTTRLRWAIERYEKNETETEESWVAYDKKVSEERKYEMGRQRSEHEMLMET